MAGSIARLPTASEAMAAMTSTATEMTSPVASVPLRCGESSVRLPAPVFETSVPSCVARDISGVTCR